MTDDAFAAWKARAEQVDLLEAARRHGAALRRNGTEWVGPCPRCGGTDRFAINPSKDKWNCRGAVGGTSRISLVMHITGLNYTEAGEALTGEARPGRAARPVSREEIERRSAERARRGQEQAEREAQEQTRRAERITEAAELWPTVVPLAGTLGETYMLSRDIPVPPMGWPNDVGFSPGMPGEAVRWHRAALPHPNSPITWPCVVGKVVSPFDEIVGLHLIFLDPVTGRKVDRDPPKLTIGAVAGGAIRLGGVSELINPCEGLETAFGVWWLIDFASPVWATLGTSGLGSLEWPLEVRRQRIWPDGDQPLKRQGDEFVPAVPAGRVAALKLHQRGCAAGLTSSVQPEPAPGRDYLDVWNDMRAMAGAA